MDLYCIPILSDNYCYAISDGTNGLVIDPGEADPVIKFLKDNHIPCQTIINTHHHYDHIAGNAAIKESFKAKLIAPKDNRIENIDIEITDESPLNLDWITFDIFQTPGHTMTHICLYERSHEWLFSGDTLFLFGCGRLFEGSARHMYTSLEKLKQLPNSTHIYCGHEYTLNNLEFCITQEPNNPQTRIAYEETKQKRLEGISTMGSLLGIQKTINPFLRCSDPNLLEAMGIENANAVNIFKELRLRKDNF